MLPEAESTDVPVPPYNDAEERRTECDREWLAECLKKHTTIFRSHALPEPEADDINSSTDELLPVWFATDEPLVGIEDPMTAFKAS